MSTNTLDYTNVLQKAVETMNSLELLRDSLINGLKLVEETILEISELREEAVKLSEEKEKKEEQTISVPVTIPVTVTEPTSPTPPPSPVLIPTVPEQPVEVKKEEVKKEEESKQVDIKDPVVVVSVESPVDTPIVKDNEEPKEEPNEEDTEFEQDPEIPADEDTEEPEEDPQEPEIIETDITQYGIIKKPVSGSVTVCCMGIDWTDVKCARVDLVGPKIQKIYNDSSSGLLKMKVTTRVVSVPFAHSAANLYAARDYAKAEVNKLNGGKAYNIYMMVHSRARNFSNATGGVAYCKDTLLRTMLHEVGHLLPFGLHHANKLSTIKVNGVQSVVESFDKKQVGLKIIENGEYCDPTSFMNKFSTWNFNVPNLLFLGWLPKEKIEVFDDKVSKTATFKLEPLYKKDFVGGLPAINSPGLLDANKAVVVKRSGKDLILSTAWFTEKNVKVLYYVVHATYGGAVNSELGPGAVFLGKFKDSTVFKYDKWTFQKVGDMQVKVSMA